MLTKQMLVGNTNQASNSLQSHNPYLEALECLNFLLPMSDSYPEIETWFMKQVVPGLYDDTRKLFIYRRNNKIVALGIAKKTTDELKICTIRVAPEFVGKGFGIKLFKQAMDWLGTNKPHLTVSEDHLADFKRIFDHFGYQLTSERNDLYRFGKVEYFFNESNILNN